MFDSSADGPPNPRIIDFFSLFIPMHCIALMCEMTNLYASQIQASLGNFASCSISIITKLLGLHVPARINIGNKPNASSDIILAEHKYVID